jgi:PAS domain S-box-containing protein
MWPVLQMDGFPMTKKKMADSKGSNLSAARIVVAYSVVSILWIAFSDAVVTHLRLSPAVMTLKGVAFVGVTASLLYVTIRRLVSAIHAERARWQGVVEGIAEEVWVCNPKGEMSLINLPAVTAMGLESFKDKSIQDVLVEVDILYPDRTARPAEQAPLLRSLRGEIVRGEEIMRHRQTGTTRYRQFSSAPTRDHTGAITGAVAIVRDITAVKQAQDALIRSEKLASVGRMAATIAHEVNNPLSAALNAVYLASSDPAASPRIRDTLSLADQELRRAAHITQQTLGFYRDNGNRTPVALPKLINEVLGVYARKLKERAITVHCRYNCGRCGEDCDTCLSANFGEMRQVISNLLGNGIDAVRDNGKLDIRVTRVTNPDGGGHDLHLTIADNGCGIRAENLKRIFEPFFTTKESVGTGLGLWITQELVRKHNGSIRVRSSARGSVFRISIPAAEVSRGEQQRAETMAS